MVSVYWSALQRRLKRFASLTGTVWGENQGSHRVPVVAAPLIESKTRPILVHVSFDTRSSRGPIGNLGRVFSMRPAPLEDISRYAIIGPTLICLYMPLAI